MNETKKRRPSSLDGALFCLAQTQRSGFEPTTAITNRALTGSTGQSRRTLTVIGPPIASSTSKATRVPSSIWRWSSGQMLDWWMKQSGPPASHVTKPCPFAESNHRTVPVACGSGGAAHCLLVLRITVTSHDRAAEREANDHQAVARIDTAVRGMPHCTTASLLTSADRTRLERPKSSALLATPAYLGPGANR